MKPFSQHTGRVAVLDRAHVDTDQIIPKQFLKRIERTGFGQFLFYNWRFREDGSADPDFELNQPKYQGASILITGENFGCGSSREHAAWALADYGFRAIIAPSFADIFYNNCFKNGLLPVRLLDDEVSEIREKVEQTPGYQLEVDLENQRITDAAGNEWAFEIEPFRRQCLLQGLDDVGLTLEKEAEIKQYEAQRRTVGRFTSPTDREDREAS